MKTKSLIPWLGLPLWAAISPQLNAAEAKFVLTASADNFELGSTFACAGDINADGVVDIAVADRSARVGNFFASGAVYLASGVDGAILRSYQGSPAASQNFGAAVVALHADGDAIPDLAIGAPGHSAGGAFGAGAVSIHAGATGAPLTTVLGVAGSQLGGTLANAGDQDGDGRDDLYAGAPMANGAAGAVYVISGASGQTLRTITTDAPVSSFGMTVATLGDIDGDGRNDVAIGAPAYHSNLSYQAGRVVIVRSTDSTRPALVGAGFYNRLGESLATVPDCNHDGLADLLVGSYSGGTALLVSGSDLSLIKDLSMPALPPYRQLTVGGSVDYDGDGTPDWLLGSPGLAVANNQVVGGVRVLSGADGSTLFQHTAATPYSGLGVVLKVLPGFGFAAGEANLRDSQTGGYGRAWLWELSADADGDGVLDPVDAIPRSIVDPTVVFPGFDTGVPNRVDDQGITLADRFATVGPPSSYKTPALWFVQIQHLAKQLTEAALLSPDENKQIDSAARRSALPAK